MLVTETFYGYIETTQDVLLIFEGCRRGLLPRICRRLQERERKMIRSGSIFVFDERESGIKRWTDGRVWSPSRILGNFLIYRELDKKSSNNEKRLSTSNIYQHPQQGGGSYYGGESSRRSFDTSMDRNKERQLVGSLSDSYKFREDGLIKKTMSIIVNGVAQHLISYYDPNEVLEEKLRAPSSVPELASLEISPELLVKQNFRIPPMVEPGTLDEQQQQRQVPPTNMRSMSVGSIKYDYNLMYHPYQQQQQRNPSIDQQQPTTSIPNTGYTLDNIPPHPPSPTTSSSNNRYHSRNSSLPRFDPRHYTRYQEERLTSPNLGRLLNPVNNQQQDLLQQMNQYNFRNQQDYLYYNSRPANNQQQQQQQHHHQQQPIMFQPPPPLQHPAANNNNNNSSNQQDHIYTNLGQE